MWESLKRIWLQRPADPAERPYYRHHVFICTNLRDPTAKRPSCGRCGAEAVRDYAKRRIKELGLAAPGQVRINQAGCMERCEQGPVLVVYPQGIWYRYRNEQDVEDIIQEHILGGRIVERLRL